MRDAVQFLPFSPSSAAFIPLLSGTSNTSILSRRSVSYLHHFFTCFSQILISRIQNSKTLTFIKMHFSHVTSVLFSLAAVASAAVVDTEGIHNAPRDAVLIGRQNQQRPVPNGNCCVANTSLKQDTCTSASGATGRCVPGGNNCKSTVGDVIHSVYPMVANMLATIGGGALSCVQQSNLQCDNNVVERGNTLCRAKAPGGGLFDGARIIQNLSQAKVN
jgi:hypothetical protein